MKIRSVLAALLLTVFMVFSCVGCGENMITLEAYSGWWVASEEAENEGNMLASKIIYIDGLNDSYASYDSYGRTLVIAPCYYDDEMKEIGFEVETDAPCLWYMANGDSLIAPETGTAHFKKVESVSFQEAADVNGKWYFLGKKENPLIYTIDESVYYVSAQSENGLAEIESGLVSPIISQFTFGDVVIPEVQAIYLESDESSMKLYPIVGTAALYQDDLGTFSTYVREDAVGQPEGKLALELGALFNTEKSTSETSQNPSCILKITPYHFEVKKLEESENGEDFRLVTVTAGRWKCDKDGNLVLTSFDGWEETVPFQDADDPITITKLGLTFDSQY